MTNAANTVEAIRRCGQRSKPVLAKAERRPAEDGERRAEDLGGNASFTRQREEDSMAAAFRLFAVTVVVASPAAVAQAQGLSRARSTLQNFQSELMLFVPIVAVVSLIILAILWGLRVIHFRTLAQWGGGVLIVGAASQLVNMLLS